MGRKTNEELLKEYHDTKDSNILSNILILNDKLNYLIAHRFRNCGEDFEDLVSISKMGMLKSIYKFDCSKGIKFTTYATRVMANEILMHLRTIKKHKEQIFVSLGTCISPDGDNSITIEDILESDIDILRDVLISEDVNEIRSAISNLKDRDMQIIVGLYVKNKNQSEVARELNLSQPQISRLEKKILSNMKRYLIA